MQRWPIARTYRAVAALALAVALTCATLAAIAPPSPAIVPPTDCGRLTVKGKRYTIKADQLTCATARPHASRYLSSHRKPKGYTCRDYGRETKLEFRCARGIKVFFAIRR
jgi:hypothetical protein